MRLSAKILAFALVGTTLSACSGIAAKQTPKEALQTALSRQFAEDGQYNFTGEGSLKLHRADKTETSDKKHNSADQIAQRLTLFLADHLSLHMEGAVDFPAGLLEIRPEMRYQARNASIAISLPMQLDWKNTTLTADPSALSPYTDIFSDTGINGRMVRFTLPERFKAPAKQIITALPQAVKDGYAAISEEAVSEQPMDEAGKKIRARRRIRLNIDDRSGFAMMDAVMASLKKQTTGTVAADIANLADLAKSIEHDTSKQPSLKNLYASQTDYYLDGRGRIIAYRTSMPVLPMFAELFGAKSGETVVWAKLDYRKPKFTINGAAADIFNFEDLIRRYERKNSSR